MTINKTHPTLVNWSKVTLSHVTGYGGHFRIPEVDFDYVIVETEENLVEEDEISDYFSTISIADSTCSNVTADRNSIRVSFIESDESYNDHQVKHPIGNDEDLR